VHLTNSRGLGVGRLSSIRNRLDETVLNALPTISGGPFSRLIVSEECPKRCHAPNREKDQGLTDNEA
jgi:hypothetical protein